tara:strand:- start:82 stop:438 length:357 start_codon:yes stop_codon:yes gene_type:complete
MKLFFLILIICFISGCASSKQTYSADGEIAHSLNCSGKTRNWGMCYEKAGEICGTKGYNILNKDGEQGASVAGATNREGSGIFGLSRKATGGLGSSRNSSGFFGTSLHFRTMTIACKN